MESENKVIVIMEQQGTYGVERIRFRFNSHSQAFIFANTLMSNSDGECAVTITNKSADVNGEKEG